MQTSAIGYKGQKNNEAKWKEKVQKCRYKNRNKKGGSLLIGRRCMQACGEGIGTEKMMRSQDEMQK